MLGAALAMMIGLYLARRVTAFPGARAFSFVLSSFIAADSILLALLFAFRFDYGRIYITVSFISTIIFAYIISVFNSSRDVPQFYVVPFGDIEQLQTIERVEWIVLQSPHIPSPQAAFVVDLRFDHSSEWERMLADAAVNGHQVYHVKQLSESLTGRVQIDHMSENSFGSLLPNLAYVRVKRVVEIILCMAVIPILILPFFMIAIAIKLDSQGPVFYVQERMGYRGRTFKMIKFRTMRPRDVAENDLLAREDAVTQTDDVRITRVGSFLRRSRLDELPQIINVLIGDMSVIGPRPEAMALSKWYEDKIPFYKYRHIVRPGITGWAQVNQGHVADLDAIAEKLNFDFYYIKNFSYWLDLLIVLRTIPTMLSGYGAK